MITAGIDMGIETTKVVVMREEEIIGRAKIGSGGIDRPQQARLAYEQALREAGIGAGDVEKIMATGKGKYDIPFADGRVTETIAAARAARALCPEATCVLSVGADETLAATLGGARPVGEYVLNQKCTAGLGTFLRYLGRRLGLSMEQMSAADGPDAGVMNEGCVVFAELDALSLLNNGAAPQAVAAAANRAAAVRAATVLKDLTVPANDRVVLIGGLSNNRAFVRALESRLGFSFTVPADAEYAGALGAALSGKEAL